MIERSLSLSIASFQEPPNSEATVRWWQRPRGCNGAGRS